MRGCAPAAIAILALEACAPSGSAKRSASFLADLPAFYTECTTTRTPEAYANCRAAQLPASGDHCDDANCFQALRHSVRAGCGDYIVFSDYMDCVAIGENRIGPDSFSGRW